MFVAKRMTANPVTITSSTTIADAAEIMRSHGFRRLPVVDNGRLVGIITDRDLREVRPSPATTLSIYEINYLLEKIKVKDIMRKKVVTIRDDATIEEAALAMYNHKIGGLVVVDANDKVVGVITETDIFKTFVDVMGLPAGKTRITVEVADSVGVLHEITGVFKELGISIGSLACSRLPNGLVEIVFRADIPNVEALTARLGEFGYRVTHVAQIG